MSDDVLSLEYARKIESSENILLVIDHTRFYEDRQVMAGLAYAKALGKPIRLLIEKSIGLPNELDVADIRIERFSDDKSYEEGIKKLSGESELFEYILPDGMSVIMDQAVLPRWRGVARSLNEIYRLGPNPTLKSEVEAILEKLVF